MAGSKRRQSVVLSLRTMKVLVLIAALLAGAHAQVSFSAQFFPGQQTQQFRQGGLRTQIVGLQRQFEAAPPGNIRAALRAQQDQLLRNFQNVQQGGQSLQTQLQDALFPGLRQDQFQSPADQFQQPQDDDQFQGEDEQFQQPQEQQDQFQGTEEPEEQFQQPQEQDDQFQGTQVPEEQFQPRQTTLFRPAVQGEVRIVQNVPRGPPCATSAGEAGACVPLVRCITFYTELPALRRQPCRLSEGQMGVCCPPRTRAPAPQGPQDRRNDGVLRAPPPPFVVIPPLSPSQLNGAAAVGLERVRQRLELAAQLFAQHIVVLPGSAAAWHQEFFQTSNNTLEVGGAAQKGVEAAVSLVNEFQLSPAQGTFALPSFSILDTQIGDTCPSGGEGGCRPSKYRRADGSCNNLANERWGRAGVALQRILPPKYDDGVNAPRWRGANGVRLPSARAVSTLFAGEADRPDERHTLMLMQWGQFLDHDLTHTPIGRGQGGAGLSCCSKGEVIAREQRHPDCFPIELPRNDHVFAPFGERCMEFVRSLPAPRPECNFGPREQMNQITGYLDASNVYGSNDAKQRQLRLGVGGRMQVQTGNDGSRTLPPGNRGECVDRTQQQACFSAGDSRVNEQPQLAVLHTVWLREHNRIATRLATLRPEWDDETLFQESRRIVAAEMQHVTYNEFLPLVLGRAYMEKFELSPRESGYTKLYDSQLNGGITNAFATAAFRFGHSLVQGTIKGYSRFGGERESLQLSKNHFSPFVLYKPGALDDLIRGLATQTCQRFDRFFSKELTERLFQGELPFGLDLVALNVQRGRDHGLPPYVEWLQVCGLDAPTSWNDLLAVMDPQSVATLRELYGSVGEVDLFIGGVAERPLPGALVGHTFNCIIGDQFARLRRGDRFFYEEADQPSSFTPAQLEELRKTSLARVLCDNSDDIAVMQPLAFLQASFANQRVSCSSESIPRVDLRAWQR